MNTSRKSNHDVQHERMEQALKTISILSKHMNHSENAHVFRDINNEAKKALNFKED